MVDLVDSLSMGTRKLKVSVFNCHIKRFPFVSKLVFIQFEEFKNKYLFIVCVYITFCTFVVFVLNGSIEMTSMFEYSNKVLIVTISKHS